MSQRSRLAPWIGAAIGAVVGYVLAYQFARNAGGLLPAGASKAALWWLLPLAPAAFFATIIVHELGHLAGARLAGFRFRLLTLGPFSLVGTPAGLRLRSNWQVLRLIGGQQLSTPPGQGASDRAYYLIYLAGGVLANALTAALALAWLLHCPMPVVPWLFLLLFAGFSLLLGIVNALPIQTPEGIATDGYNIRALLRGGAQAERFRALLSMLGLIYSGVRPADWPQAVVDAIGGDAPARPGYLAALAPCLRLQWAIDRQDDVEAAAAAAQLEAIYGSLQGPIRPHFAAELAYWHGAASPQPDAALAQRYAEDAARSAYLISPATVRRAQAAAALASGRFDDAVAHCDAGLACGAAALNEFDRTMEPLWLQALKDRAQAAGVTQADAAGKEKRRTVAGSPSSS
jgi:hypothetical protein